MSSWKILRDFFRKPHYFTALLVCFRHLDDRPHLRDLFLQILANFLDDKGKAVNHPFPLFAPLQREGVEEYMVLNKEIPEGCVFFPYTSEWFVEAILTIPCYYTILLHAQWDRVNLRSVRFLSRTKRGTLLVLACALLRTSYLFEVGTITSIEFYLSFFVWGLGKESAGFLFKENSDCIEEKITQKLTRSNIRCTEKTHCEV